MMQESSNLRRLYVPQCQMLLAMQSPVLTGDGHGGILQAIGNFDMLTQMCWAIQ